MSERKVSNLTAGLVLATLGGVSLTLGLVRVPFLATSVGGLPAYGLASLAGVVFLLSGTLFMVFSVRTPEVEAEILPAHVAFMSRSNAAVQEELRQLAATPKPKPTTTPAAAAVAAKPVQVDPEQVAMDRLNREIRELTRAINKAGVMLATGQLSDGGYAQYVEELKKQRGTLEADRLRIELRKKTS